MKKTFFLLFTLMLMLGAKQVLCIYDISWTASSYEPNATGVTYTFTFTTSNSNGQAASFRIENTSAAWQLSTTSYNATATGGTKTLNGDPPTSMPAHPSPGYKIWFAASPNPFGVLDQSGTTFTVTITDVTNGTAGTYAWTVFAIYTGGNVLVESGSPDALVIAEGGGGGGGGGANLPIVTTSTASSITMDGATLGGSVTDEGGSAVTAKGVAYSTEPNSVSPDLWPMGFGIGTFSDDLHSMDPLTKYYYRAYATNDDGTSYGEEYNFTTLPDKPDDPTGVTGPNGKICPGSPTQLTAQGAIGSVYWYTGGCGSTQVGTPGNPITVSPTITTTYYARNYDNAKFSDGCASFTVNVELPLILTCPDNFNKNTDPNVCTASVAFAATTSGTPAPVLTYKVGGNPITSPYDFPKGTTTVDVTAVNSCSTKDCSFTVTVTDIQKPQAVTKDIPSIQLDLSGNLSIDPELEINDGSSDNCEIETYELDKPTFTPADKGNNVVTLTVTDYDGNDDSETADVFVENIPKPYKWGDTHANAQGFSDYDFHPTNPTFYLTSKGLSTTTNDVMHFVYQPLTGNGTIITRIADVKNDGWAGVMMRESCAPNAKTILFKTRLYNPTVIIGTRTTTGKTMTNTSQSQPNIRWMKIQRNGNTFQVFVSANGTSWTRAYTATIAMNNTIYAGIFTDNYTSSKTTQAWFDKVELSNTLKSGDDFAKAEILIEANEKVDVQIYPNPAKEQVNILVPGWTNCKASLISAEGKVLKTFTISTIETKLDVQDLKPGLYILRFESEEDIVIKRLVIQ